jgi:hypothetical protein
MLNDYIKIALNNTHNNYTKFATIDFHLDRDRLHKIQRDRAKHKSLKLSRSFLLKFRYQILVDRQNLIHSGLTFCTYYHYNNLKKAAIKSIIFLDGQVNQQICQDFLEDTELVKHIISSHYWLSEQLLTKINLTTKINNRFYFLFSSLCLTIFAIVYYLNISIFARNIIDCFILIAIFFLSQIVFKIFLELFLPNLRSWFLHQLLFGIFSDRLKNRNIAFKILQWTGF